MTTPSLYVRDYMSSRFGTVQQDQDIREALQLLTEKDFYGAAVLDQLGNLVGIISVTDGIDFALKTGFDPNWRGTVGHLMATDVRTVEVNDNVMDIAERFMNSRYRRYPVLDDNRVVGLITRLDVLKAMCKITQAGGLS